MNLIKRWTAMSPLVLAAACGGGGQNAELASLSPGPALVTERFLQAANVNDLGTMTELFGTKDRSIVQLDGQAKAEQRMYLLASLLRHNDFSVRGQRAVPGRMAEATELTVELDQGGRTVLVPFVVVRRSRGGWIIENIDVTAITNRR